MFIPFLVNPFVFPKHASFSLEMVGSISWTTDAKPRKAYEMFTRKHVKILPGNQVGDEFCLEQFANPQESSV